MSRLLDMYHEAAVAAIAAVQTGGYISPDKHAVRVTGAIEREPLGQLNIMDSESSFRTAIAVGWN